MDWDPEKWRDPRYIWEIEPTGIGDRLGKR